MDPVRTRISLFAVRAERMATLVSLSLARALSGWPLIVTGGQPASRVPAARPKHKLTTCGLGASIPV